MTASHPQEAEPAGHGAAAAAEHHVGHPGPREYVTIAVILAAITAVEVAVYYLDALRAVLAPILIVLSLTKFALVALFFMHLKFDSRFFSVVFVTGLLVAVGVFVVFLSMIRVFFA
jgi:cytochrome c oxidase subunit IV